MPIQINRAVLVATVMALATPACGGNSAVPSSASAGNSNAAGSRAAVASPEDKKSILKLLTKNVTIGSTVDPTNGDMGPRAISVLQA
ncbi:MAG: hypothetical protein ABSD52_13915, partial [Candidatus Cybelea sp.]